MVGERERARNIYMYIGERETPVKMLYMTFVYVFI